jgi:hypothetical protein
MYASAARELIRAIRGKRSQIALSRRLGYRGNPLTDWEAGRSFPNALEVLEAARMAKLPVQLAFERFHPAPAPALEIGALGLAAWLNAVRGSTTLSALAERVGSSRYSVRRWFSADTQIKLPAFLQVLDAMTDRVPDWVAELVDIEQVPSLRDRFLRVQLAKQLAFDLPWSEAILRVLETTAFQQHPHPGAELLAAWLGADIASVRLTLAQMAAAGVIRQAGDSYAVVGTLSVDTRVKPDGLRRLRRHWLDALSERSHASHPEDWSAYTVMSVSTADLVLIKERLQALYREVQTRVAASEPPEEVALVMLQLVRWMPP